MSNFKKNLIYGIAGLAVTGTGYILSQYLKQHKDKNEYQPVCALLGDVGGTNIRFQLVLIKPPNDTPQKTFKKKTYPVTSYQHFIDAVRDFLQQVEIYPKVAVIGIAGPVSDNKISMANVPKWGQLDGNQIGNALNIREFEFINDFQAISYGLLLLKDQDLISVNGKEIVEDKTRGVMGPGTGLGVSVLFTSPFRKRKRVYVLPSEGGHTDFCHIDQQTTQFFEFMKQKTGYHYISRERSFCGPAIPYMFQFFARKFPDLEDSKLMPTSQQIIMRCRQQIDKPDYQTSLYFKTLGLFIKLYSSAIGNFMAHHMCTGGIYLVGSLTNAILPFIQGKNLIEKYLERHHQIESTLIKIPIVLSREIDLGLKGAFVVGRRIISDQQHG